MPFFIVGLVCLGVGGLFGFTLSKGFNALFYLLLSLSVSFAAYRMGWIN